MLDGWFELTPELLEERRSALSSEDLKRFFDGQEPDWRHALAPEHQIPRRPVAVDGLTKMRAPDGSQAVVLLVGADGTGKSTALLQIASDLVADGRRLLVRSAGATLDASAVMELEGDWVLVSDDANEIAQDFEKVVQQLFTADRRNVHWLLSAREADWKAQFLRYGRSLEPAWERFGDLWPALGNRAAVLSVTATDAAPVTEGLAAWAAGIRLGSTAADGPAILAAWAGVQALGAAAALPEGERAEALEERSTKKLGISDGTLLGGSLDLRYGADGLTPFVEEIVRRLDGDAVREAFLFAAAAQVAGVDGLDLFVLADLIGVDREQRREAILGRLAEAGLASGTAGALRPRHPAIARVAVQLVAEGRLEGDLEDLYRRLIRGTAATGNDVKSLSAGGAIMNCGPLLSEKLQQLGLPRDRSDQIACTVADEAEVALPDYLLFTVARARTFRAAGRPVDARRALRARFADATTKNDWDVVGRAYLQELSGPEAAAGRLAEAVTLAGLALADAEGLGQVTMADGKLALLALGDAASELALAERPDATEAALFRRQLRACTHLGEKVTPKWDQRARFDFHTFAVKADEYEIPKTSAAEALLWLGETVTTAMGMVDDPEVKDLAQRLVPESGALGFTHLEHTIGLGRLPWAKE
ncbi:MAG: hypothetical protein QOF81_245 [Acidimicrobiaceae bacterium]|nr:hypothetical protein [Acidimicrobiaceae bacterium]